MQKNAKTVKPIFKICFLLIAKPGCLWDNPLNKIIAANNTENSTDNNFEVNAHPNAIPLKIKYFILRLPVLKEYNNNNRANMLKKT